MRTLWSTLVCTLGLVCFTQPTYAQSASLPDTLDWPTLQTLLLKQSPQLLTLEAHLKRAESEHLWAHESPNPTLDIQLLRHLAGTDTFDKAQVNLGFSQPLRLVGKSKARQQVAQAGVALAEKEAMLIRQKVLLEGRTLLLELGHLQAQLENFTALLSELQILETHLNQRQHHGMASAYEAQRLQQERLKLERERTLLEMEATQRTQALAQLVGVPHWQPRVEASLEVVLPQPKAESPPSLALAEAKVAQSNHLIRSAEKERWPDLVLSAGVSTTVDEFGLAPYVGLSMDLMLFDKGRSSIAKAEADSLLARQELLQTQRYHESQLNQVKAKIASLQDLLAAWQTQVTRDEALSHLAFKAYQAGKADLHEVLDALSSEADFQRQGLSLQHELAQAKLQLWALQGIEVQSP